MSDVRRVYRYTVPADDQAHKIVMFGAAPILAVSAPAGGQAVWDTRPASIRCGRQVPYVEFWAEHYDSGAHDRARTFRVLGTGHPVPRGYNWVATCLRPPLGLHLYEKG